MLEQLESKNEKKLVKKFSKNGGIEIMENKELKENNIDNKYGIEYTKVGDYYMPNLVLEKEEKIILNKYGQHSSFEASECILFPKKDQRDWEAYFIDSGYRINIFSRLAGLNISNRMFYYKDVGDCKIKLNLEKRNIEVYTSTPPYHIDTLDEFGFSSRRSIFLTPFKHSSYLDWVDVPKELLIETLVVASNNKTFWSIGTYEGNQCVTTTFPKKISARYQYIVPYNLFNLETGEFPESEIMNVLKD